MLYYFYCITNTQNGKKYIGLSKRDIQIRFQEHIKYALCEHDIKNDYFMPILNAIRKYGEGAFTISIIDEKDFDSFSDAEIYEGSLIVKYKSLLRENGYNLNYRKEDGSRFYVDVIKEKVCRNNSGENNPFYNKRHTDETKLRLSEIAKERFSKPENNPRFGYKFSKEEILKARNDKLKYSKPFFADGKEYNFLTEAAECYGLTKQAISHRLKSPKFKGWYYK